jgi:hypothetical protein
VRDRVCKVIQDTNKVLKDLRELAGEATLTFAVGYGLYLFVVKVLFG